MTVEMNSSASAYPISVDPTFNFGAYEVTPFTYRSILVESKSKNVTGEWVPATMIGPTNIQHEKSTEMYQTAMRCVGKKCDLEEKDDLYIITDGEPPLINACKEIFSIVNLGVVVDTLRQIVKNF